MGRPFILDANVLITASRQYYGFDTCPGFWELMAKGFHAGLLVSHRKVYEELKEGEDRLWDWASRLPRECFPRETQDELRHYVDLQNWAAGRNYRKVALERFGADAYADPWICAKAKALDAVLVTNEVSAPNAKNDVKLPDACAAIGVECCDTFRMLQRLNASFLLDPDHSF